MNTHTNCSSQNNYKDIMENAHKLQIFPFKTNRQHAKGTIVLGNHGIFVELLGRHVMALEVVEALRSAWGGLVESVGRQGGLTEGHDDGRVLGQLVLFVVLNVLKRLLQRRLVSRHDGTGGGSGGLMVV